MNLRALDEQQTELLRSVDGWSEARLAFRPSPSEWSAADVFDHLERTERAILEAAKAGLDKPHRVGIRDKVGYQFIHEVFSSERRVKVPPSAKFVLPSPDPQMTEVLSRWRETRESLRAFHGNLTPEQLKMGIFRHPVAGWMDVAGIVGFFSVHMRHHAFQLARLQAASGKR